MLHALMLAATLDTDHATKPASPIAACLATMDGAVYHGDPTDKRQMRAGVAACARGIAALDRLRPATTAQGPEKLFIAGRVLDRAATLSYMGLGDWATALREVRLANLYFRVASGLAGQDAAYREAALANVKLTGVQLHTLAAEALAAQPSHAGAARVVAATTSYNRRRRR